MSPATEPVADSPWRAGPRRPRLTPAEVHVWRVSLDVGADALEHLHALLDADERTRADRFRFARHRRAFVASHGALRSILGRYLDAPPAALSFVSNDHGKPRLPSAAAPRFNLSHSGDLALVAVAAALEVGVDIERIRLPSPADDVAPRLFGAAEYALWRALPPAERQQVFFRGWAVKEAAVKAIGRGISYRLHDLEALRPSADGGRMSFAPELAGAGREWRVVELAAAPGYAAAVVAGGDAFRLRLYDWEGR